jgi:hypothetical protein
MFATVSIRVCPYSAASDGVIQCTHQQRNPPEQIMQTAISQDLQEMMSAWANILSTARQQLPAANEEEIYQMASAAMRRLLGI